MFQRIGASHQRSFRCRSHCHKWHKRCCTVVAVHAVLHKCRSIHTGKNGSVECIPCMSFPEYQKAKLGQNILLPHMMGFLFWCLCPRSHVTFVLKLYCVTLSSAMFYFAVLVCTAKWIYYKISEMSQRVLTTAIVETVNRLPVVLPLFRSLHREHM